MSNRMFFKCAWSMVSFSCLDCHQAYGGTIEELEDAQLQLQTLLSMRHVTPFREVVQVKLFHNAFGFFSVVPTLEFKTGADRTYGNIKIAVLVRCSFVLGAYP